jgi:hypothetical protein
MPPSTSFFVSGNRNKPTGPMYVERFDPSENQRRHPVAIVLIHGDYQNGGVRFDYQRHFLWSSCCSWPPTVADPVVKSRSFVSLIQAPTGSNTSLRKDSSSMFLIFHSMEGRATSIMRRLLSPYRPTSSSDFTRRQRSWTSPSGRPLVCILNGLV